MKDEVRLDKSVEIKAVPSLINSMTFNKLKTWQTFFKTNSDKIKENLSKPMLSWKKFQWLNDYTYSNDNMIKLDNKHEWLQ